MTEEKVRMNLQDAILLSRIEKTIIADKINISRTQLYNVLKGKTRMTVEFVLKVCEVIEVEPKNLFSRKNGHKATLK